MIHPLPNIAFITKTSVNNGSVPPSCHFPVLMTPFLFIAFTNEEATGCISEEAIGSINKAAIGTTIAPTNLPFGFYVLLFDVLLFQQHHRY